MLKSGKLQRHHSLFSLAQQVLDAVVVFALLPVLCSLRGTHFDQLYQVTAVLGALLTWVSMGVVGAYRPWRGSGFLQELSIIFGAWIPVTCGLLFIAWAVKFTEVYSRIVLGGWFLLSP